jgi:hypothetical protein
MPFDAGSIMGSLGLDVSGFTGGMLRAEGIAHLFPEVVTEFMANPLLGFIDLAKEAGKALEDAFLNTVNAAEDTGLLAKKIGASVEFLSDWTAVASTVKVSQQELGVGFKFMLQNADEAVQGNKKALDAYERAGIGIEFLKAHLNDAQGLWLATREGLDGISNSADRLNLTREILGRGGMGLSPVLGMDDADVQKIIGNYHAVGAAIDAEEAKAAQKFTNLKATFDFAWEGIVKKASEPILQFFADHADEIADDIVFAAQKVEGAIENAWSYLESPDGAANVRSIKEDFDKLYANLPSITEELRVMLEVIKPISWILGNTMKLSNLSQQEMDYVIGYGMGMGDDTKNFVQYRQAEREGTLPDMNPAHYQFNVTAPPNTQATKDILKDLKKAAADHQRKSAAEMRKELRVRNSMGGR